MSEQQTGHTHHNPFGAEMYHIWEQSMGCWWDQALESNTFFENQGDNLASQTRACMRCTSAQSMSPSPGCTRPLEPSSPAWPGLPPSSTNASWSRKSSSATCATAWPLSKMMPARLASLLLKPGSKRGTLSPPSWPDSHSSRAGSDPRRCVQSDLCRPHDPGALRAPRAPAQAARRHGRDAAIRPGAQRYMAAPAPADRAPPHADVHRQDKLSVRDSPPRTETRETD